MHISICKLLMDAHIPLLLQLQVILTQIILTQSCSPGPSERRVGEEEGKKWQEKEDC